MNNSISNALYRYGFSAWLKSNDSIDKKVFEDEGFYNWNLCCFGDMFFKTHPELTVRRFSVAEYSVVALGDMFTCVDGESIDNVLRQLCESSNDEFSNRLSLLSGRFVIFISGPEGVKVANDAFGARTVFYSSECPGVVSSHSELLARLISAKPDEDMRKLIGSDEYKSRTVKYLPGDHTLWSGVLALIPNNALILKTSKTFRYWPNKSLEKSTFEDFYRELSIYYDQLASFLSSPLKPVIGVTSGIDTRSVFVALNSRNVPFLGITWSGGYVKDKEVPIIERLVFFMGIEHSYIEMDNVEYDMRYADIAKKNSGWFRGRSRLAANMVKNFKSIENEIFVLGYGGEIIRGFYSLSEKFLDGYTVDSFVENYGSSMKNKTPSNEYLEIVRHAFEGFEKRGNYQDSEFLNTYPARDIFYWEHRMGMWGAAMLNEMDTAVYSFVGMNSRRLYDVALGLDDSTRLSKELFHTSIKRMNPEIAKIPYL